MPNTDFYYCESSPSCLRWNTTSSNHKKNNGDVAGSLSDRYYIVGHNSKLVYAHVLVYELHFGSVPEDKDVNHIDGDSTNNKINNLELVSHQINCLKTKVQRDNPNCGVSEMAMKSSKSTLYYACCSYSTINGNRVRKLFSYKKYGILEAIASAHKLRKEKYKCLIA